MSCTESRYQSRPGPGPLPPGPGSPCGCRRTAGRTGCA
jgi:hypothetical protein